MISNKKNKDYVIVEAAREKYDMKQQAGEYLLRYKDLLNRT